MSQTINDVVEACVLISQLLGEHLRCCKPLPNTLRFLKDRIVPGARPLALTRRRPAPVNAALLARGRAGNCTIEPPEASSPNQ